MHTTHATRLFLDVTDHVSRTRIHMRVNTFHVVPQQRFCLYFYCNAKSDTAQLQVDEKTSIDLHRIFISSHSFFFPILIKIWHTIIFNNKLFFFLYMRENTSILKHFSQFVFCYLSERKLHFRNILYTRVEWMRNRLGFLSTLLNSFLRGGSNEFVTYFALRI